LPFASRRTPGNPIDRSQEQPGDTDEHAYGNKKLIVNAGLGHVDFRPGIECRKNDEPHDCNSIRPDHRRTPLQLISRIAANICAALLISSLAFAPAQAKDMSQPTWSEIDSANTATPPDGWPSGTMTPNQVEPTARSMMGALKRWYDHSNATKTSVGIDTITLTYDVAPVNYNNGDHYVFIVGNTNTGNATLNINGLGAKTILAGAQPLVAGQLAGGTIASVYYDGTNFQLMTNLSTTPALAMPINLVTGGAIFANISNPAENVVQLQGEGNSLTTAFHINPGSGTLPTGTIDEFVLHRSTLQAFGGDYGRWSFTAQGPSQANATGLYGEFGGAAPIGPFILQVGIENPPSTFTSYEGFRFQTTTTGSEDDNTGAVLFGSTATVPRNQIALDIANIGSNGTRDSHAILWEGKANNGTERAVWWRAKVVTTSQAGNSTFVLQQNLNGAGWTNWLTITDAGLVSMSKLLVTSASPISSSACSQGQMTSDADYVYVCTSLNTWKRAALSSY
jgi:hypothetical protein